jgi:hypothetical protein
MGVEGANCSSSSPFRSCKRQFGREDGSEKRLEGAGGSEEEILNASGQCGLRLYVVRGML